MDEGRRARKALRGLYYLGQCTWGIFQNLAGAMLWLFLTLKDPHRKHSRYRGAFVTHWHAAGSMGLGMFIFFGHEGRDDAGPVMVHEFGHTVQSAFLGPLFLPVIGLPSFLWANLPPFVKLRARRHIGYMKLYCEAWANHLGTRVTGLSAPKY